VRNSDTKLLFGNANRRIGKYRNDKIKANPFKTDIVKSITVQILNLRQQAQD